MRAALAGLAALAVAMGIGRFAFTPILPMMQSEGLLTVVQAGWLASANYVGYLAGALSAMVLRGPRRAWCAWAWWSSGSPPWRWDSPSRN